jgi:polysaccharide deacetylase family sporulation protein PdaB
MKLPNGIWSLFFLTIMLFMTNELSLVDIPSAIRKVPTTDKVVALTFDDGPLNGTTPEILHILKNKNVKATFFVVGERVKKFPKLVQQEIAEGHEIGSHTYSHPQLPLLTKTEIEEELSKTEESISQLAPKPTLFRPPGGKYSNAIVKLAQDKGYTIILWSIDPYDWRSPPVGKIVDSVLNNIKPGSIILLHDGIYPSPTPEAVEFIIDSLKSRGYEFVTVSQLLQHYDAKLTWVP